MNLYQDLFFRGLDFIRGRRNIERLRFLRGSQHWSAEELACWQLTRLNVLLEEARSHSTFYRQRLADVRLPLRSLDELVALPVLRKRHIQRHLTAIRTTHLPRSRYLPSHTGGSTGEPTHFFLDRQGKDWNRGTVYRSAEWAGTALGEREVHLSGSILDAERQEKLLSRLGDILLRHRSCPLATATPEILDRHRQTLHSFRPASVWGYASGIAELTRHIARHHPDDRFPSVKAVITSSETLTGAERAEINGVFGPGAVFDHYGSREMYLAAECAARTGYHLHGEVVIVEVVDGDDEPCPPGEVGRVLVTDLTNHAFPFLRYEIGDLAAMAAPGACPCGVALPRLAGIEGRLADVVTLADRAVMPPAFVTLFEQQPGVRRFQVRQETPDAIHVVIEPEPDFDPATREQIRERIHDLVAGQARVEVELGKPEISATSGKRPLVVSRLPGKPSVSEPAGSGTCAETARLQRPQPRPAPRRPAR